MDADRPVPRRFFTTRNLENVEAGGTLVIGPRDVVTDEGRQRAGERDITIVIRDATASPPPATPPATLPAPPEPHAAPTPIPAGALREALIRAVRTELGPREGLEAAVDAVLAREGNRGS